LILRCVRALGVNTRPRAVLLIKLS
jgi:hypothetical protein